MKKPLDKATMRAAIKTASRRIPIKGDKALNAALEPFCGDFAEAYRIGAEEAQSQIGSWLRKLMNPEIIES